MKISHIICRRNRAEQLRVTLDKFNLSLMKAHQIELVLVVEIMVSDDPYGQAACAERIATAGA